MLWDLSHVVFCLGGLASYVLDPVCLLHHPLPPTPISFPSWVIIHPQLIETSHPASPSSPFLFSTIIYSVTLTSQPLAIPNKPPLLDGTKGANMSAIPLVVCTSLVEGQWLDSERSITPSPIHSIQAHDNILQQEVTFCAVNKSLSAGWSNRVLNIGFVAGQTSGWMYIRKRNIFGKLLTSRTFFPNIGCGITEEYCADWSLLSLSLINLNSDMMCNQIPGHRHSHLSVKLLEK